MKTKRMLSAVISMAMLASIGLTGCGSSNSGSTGNSGNADTSAAGGDTASADKTAVSGDANSITVWMPEDVSAMTQDKLNSWLSSSEFNGQYTITVSAMGEGEAATQMLTDVEAGADVFGFAQDQLSRLVAAGALSAPGGVFLDNVTKNNDAGSVGAASLNGKVQAYPETSDNGYFLYYDKSIISDTSTLEGILDQCAAGGKNFYMDLQSGWYDVAFFFGTGAECYYEYDSDGNVTSAVCDYSGDKGVKAMKAMRDLAANPAFSQTPDGAASLFDPNGGTAAALVSGTWDSATVSGFLGDNYGACKLPTFTVDGETFQMSGFGGFKLVGVKPQTDSDKLTFCHAVADYLTSEEMQLARFDSNGWGPSNLNAQKSDKVQSNIALAAIGDQLQYCIGQGQYPNDYWNLTEAFGTDINSGKYKDASDDDLRAALTDLENSIKAAK